jgi:Glycosyltransferase family 87
MQETRTHKRLRMAMLIVLGGAAVFSVVLGIRHAFQNQSHDLQWSGARLLSLHIDPWQERLSGLPHHPSHFSPPNYLHLFYLLLLPFGLLSFHTAEIVWCVGNICLSILAVLLLQRLFSLDRFQTTLVLCLLWMSTPFRVTLEVGQMSLFELFFFCAAYVAVSTWLSGICLGFSLVKYSFSPVVGLLFLFRGRIRLLLIAVGVVVAGLIGVHLLLPTPLLRLAAEPFLVSRIAVNPGIADLMTFSEYLFRYLGANDRAVNLSYALALACGLLYAIFLSRFRLSKGAELTLVSLASLFLFKHLIYDYVFLAIPLSYALSRYSSRRSRPIFLGIFVFWFLAIFLNRAIHEFNVNLVGLAVNVFVLALLFAYTTYVVIQEELRAKDADHTLDAEARP